MTELVELVDLPDSSVRPLVHPLDVAEAAWSYRRGWLIGILGAPAVGLMVGVATWRLGADYLIAVTAGLSLVGIATWVSQVRMEGGWAYIPRRRQDRGRALPPTWQVSDGVISGAAIAVAAGLASTALVATGVSAGVRSFIVGASVALAVLVGLDLVSSALLRRGSFVGRAWYAGPLFAGVIVAMVLNAGASGTRLSGSDAVLGALMLLAVGAASAIRRTVRRRRATSGAR